jgi:Fe-S-cluster containining protein
MINTIVMALALLVLLLALFIGAGMFLFYREFEAISVARKLRNREWLCLRCSDCCQKTVLLSAADLARLQEATGSPRGDFASRFAWLRVLKKAPDGHCIFHLHNSDNLNSVSACSVYLARPEACRRFPYLRYFGRPGLDPRCLAVKNHLRENKIQ